MKYKYLFILAIIPITFLGCRKDFKFDNFNYETYNRIVGPEGGKIDFYANYSNDNSNEIIATLDIPQGALDSVMVFNMYQHEDYEIVSQMQEGFAKFGSKLLYFVPFFESEGYHERNQLELNYHLSVKFKKPVKVTYHPLANYSDLVLKNWQEVELYYNYYKSTNRSYKVYRIKIPRIDEWGEANNIFVNWNRQGYANGYDATDLNYIVNGRWTASDPWGTGDISMENWELVGQYTINTENDVVSFDITDSDHIYVIARDIYLSTVPPALTGIINADPLLSTLQMKRVSFDQTNYKVYFTDNTVAVFDENQNFLYRINDSYTFNNLPTLSQTILNTTFKGDNVEKVSLKNQWGITNYEVVLRSGIRVTFDANGGLSNVMQFGYNPQNLSDTITDYIAANFPGQLITNVIREISGGYPYFTIYLSSDIKVYFSSTYWNRTVYYRMNSNKLPAPILEMINSISPNPIFNEINFVRHQEGVYFEIHLVGNKYFYFQGENGELGYYYVFRNLGENEIPAAVLTAFNARFPNEIITNIWYYHYNYGGANGGNNYGYYRIYYSNINVGFEEYNPDGTLF